MIKDLDLKYIDINQFKKEVYVYYLKIFPRKERKPIELIQSSYEKQYTKIIEILYKDELVGFMILNRIKDKGYDEDYCNICLTHSYLNNDIICTAGGVPNSNENPFLTEFIKKHEYTIEEKIINLCDLMCSKQGKIYTIDKRLIDIIIRRGAYTNTQYHVKETYKLKDYFDNLLGYNLYDLFPEIKDNL